MNLKFNNNKITTMCQVQKWYAIWKIKFFILHVYIFIDKFGAFACWIWWIVFIGHWDKWSKVRL